MSRAFLLILLFLQITVGVKASYLIIPMDESQTNHLKAYGITYWVLQKELPVDWLLNYRGGSFMMKYLQSIENELIVRNVSYEVISDAESNQIFEMISSPASNTDIMKLEKYPTIAVYSPKSKQPWDDAVTLALTYAEIPYETVFDDEVIYGELPLYDWLHLHHEDFTGQYGKFYSMYRSYPWYIKQQQEYEASAKKHGFEKVSQLKLAIATNIRDFVAGGGFLFAMCSATDTYDIALAGQNVDMIEGMFDGDAADPMSQKKLDFSQTFAFENF
ncbi:MAG: asparagine synthetase B, partial [Bacteroidetes bacterium]